MHVCHLEKSFFNFVLKQNFVVHNLKRWIRGKKLMDILIMHKNENIFKTKEG